MCYKTVCIANVAELNSLIEETLSQAVLSDPSVTVSDGNYMCERKQLHGLLMSFTF